MDVAGKLLSENLLPLCGSVLAVEQTRGRGRRLRQWTSPPGNIYGSWYWPPEVFPCLLDRSWSTLAPLLAAESVAVCLRAKGLSVQIKWPNDIISDHRKVCGILVEDLGVDRIVGAGLNLVDAPADCRLRKDFTMSAGDLGTAGSDGLKPLSLWLELVDGGRKRIREITSCLSPSDFVKMLERHLAWRGKKVLVKTDRDGEFCARIEGLTEQGGLRLRQRGKEMTIYSGTTIPDF